MYSYIEGCFDNNKRKVEIKMGSYLKTQNNSSKNLVFCEFENCDVILISDNSFYWYSSRQWIRTEVCLRCGQIQMPFGAMYPSQICLRQNGWLRWRIGRNQLPSHDLQPKIGIPLSGKRSMFAVAMALWRWLRLRRQVGRGWVSENYMRSRLLSM